MGVVKSITVAKRNQRDGSRLELTSGSECPFEGHQIGIV